MAFVIFNADDFGYSDTVNWAVLKAHREGVLTSASLMVTEPGFPEAVAMARETPSLGVGLHVVVSFDHALLSPSQISALVGADGKFLADPFLTGLRYQFSQAARRQLRQELEAQFARFAETDLPWSHVDGHQHLHMHPFVWDSLLDLCDHYGVHRLRLPHEEVRAHLQQGGDGPNANTAATLALRTLRRRNLRVLRQRGTLGGKPAFYCDRVYGQLQTGRMDAPYARRLLHRLTGQTNEVYFHPGAPHACSLPSAQQTEGLRDVELHALLDTGLRDALTVAGLQRGTYAEAENWARQNPGDAFSLHRSSALK